MTEPNNDEPNQSIDVKALTLWQRVFAIQAEGTRVEKKGRNSEHMYNYARAQDIVATAQRLFTKWRVIPQITYAYLGDGIPDKQFVNRLIATLTLINPDNPDDKIVWGTFPGAGQDMGDKGPYKAMTGAAKYAFISACLFEPTDDPEDSGKRTKPKKAAQRPTQTTGPTTGTQQGATTKLTGETPKDSTTFWTEVRAAGLFQVAKDKIEREHKTWQEIWKDLTQPSVPINGNGKSATVL